MRLVDASGLPATVFGDDGVSRYPNEMVTGQTVTDQGGTQYSMPAGVFRFPLVAPGTYRLEVLPPGSYSFPSQRTIADLQTLPNAPFRLQPGSFGQNFIVAAAPAVAVDLPLDANESVLVLRKTAGQQIATTGDFVQYTLTLQNNSESGAINNVQVVDRFPAGARYRAGSLRLDGTRIADPAVAADGTSFTYTQPQPARGSEHHAALRARIHGGHARQQGCRQHRAGVRAGQRALQRSALAGAHERRTVLAEGLHRRTSLRGFMRR